MLCQFFYLTQRKVKSRDFLLKPPVKILENIVQKKKKEISFVCFLFLASVVADTNFQ